MFWTVLSIASLCILVLSCSKADPVPPPVKNTPAPVTEKAPPPSPPEKTIKDKLEEAKTINEALAITKPLMEDKMDEISAGHLLLAVWLDQHKDGFFQLLDGNDTSFAVAMKDPEEARGKRICVTGRIVQISVVKIAAGKFNDGIMWDSAGNLYRYTTVGTSGNLVESSRARLCGMLTGRFDYHNSVGGAGHALSIVGIFDLPQNR